MQHMISLAGRGLAEGASRAASRAALYFGLAITMTAGLAFLLVAASIAIAGLYGVVIGWLFAGSVLIVIALLGFLLMASRRRRVLVRQAPVRPVSDVDLALGLMPSLMRTSPWVVLAVCAAGAFFTARRVHGDKTQTDRR